MQLSRLQAINIQKEFTKSDQIFSVLKDISYSFEQNKTYAITGASGSGKSTFINILAGIDVATSGSVLFNNNNINNLTANKKEDFLNNAIGLVFQESFLIKELSVIENIMIKGLIKHQDYNICKEKAMGLLQKIGLESKANSSPAILSGGQKQRIAILRAIFNEPKFLIADEPTGNLDENTACEIKDFLLECVQDWNMGLIVSTHDVKLENSMDIALELKNGLIEEKIKPTLQKFTVERELGNSF